MAISNFTKSVMSSVFYPLRAFAKYMPVYEKISSSRVDNVASFDGNLVGRSLAMLSSSYFFRAKCSYYPDIIDLGSCRVVSVVLNESSPPELGLLSADGDICFYPIDSLFIKSIH